MNELLEEIRELKELIKTSHKEVFNSTDAAKYLTISYDSLLRLARIGQIAHAKNGTSYIFKKEDLDNWLDRNRREVV